MINVVRTIKTDLGYCHIKEYTNSKQFVCAIFKTGSDTSEPVELFMSLDSAIEFVHNTI